MKKLSLILAAVAALAVAIYCFSRPNREIAQTNNSQAIFETAGTTQTQTNLHFDGLHANPTVQ